MSNELIYATIRNTVTSFLPDARILLFGSRARGNQDLYSDYDLLIITSRTLTPNEKVAWSTRLNKALVKAVNAPFDLLINSKEEVEQKRELPGHIIRSILREGVSL
jgi:predicted nucleotidyltransferase